MEIPHWDLNGHSIIDIDEEMSMEEILDNGFAMFSNEEKALHYCNCYVLMNGIIKIDEILTILKVEHNLDITKEQLIEVASLNNQIKVKYEMNNVESPTSKIIEIKTQTRVETLFKQ